MPDPTQTDIAIMAKLKRALETMCVFWIMVLCRKRCFFDDSKGTAVTAEVSAVYGVQLEQNALTR